MSTKKFDLDEARALLGMFSRNGHRLSMEMRAPIWRIDLHRPRYNYDWIYVRGLSRVRWHRALKKLMESKPNTGCVGTITK